MTQLRPLASVIVPLATIVLAACGPKEPPEPPEPEGPTPEELAQQQALAEQPYHEAVQKFNEAIWELKPDLMHEALTEQTYELFMERSRKEAELRDIDEEIDDMWFLEQQKDYKIVYSIKSVDLESGKAVVEGIIEGEVQWESEITFVEEDGLLKIDHTPVLQAAVDKLEASIEEKEANEAAVTSRVETLIADHNTAIADENPEMLESTITATTAEKGLELLSVLPKKQGGKKKPEMKHFVAYKADKIERLELVEIDFVALEVKVMVHPVVPKKLKKGEEPPQPTEKVLVLVEENGKLYFDCSEELQERIDELTAESE